MCSDNAKEHFGALSSRVLGELIDYDKTVEAMKKVQVGELANVSYKAKRSTYYLRMTTKKCSDGDRCIHFYYYGKIDIMMSGSKGLFIVVVAICTKSKAS